MDSKKYLESYEKILVAWTSIKDTFALDQDIEQANGFIFKNYAQSIVDAFMQSRLSSYNFDLDNVRIMEKILLFLKIFEEIILSGKYTAC